MNLRLCLFSSLLAVAACQDLPFLSHGGSGSSRTSALDAGNAAADGDAGIGIAAGSAGSASSSDVGQGANPFFTGQVSSDAATSLTSGTEDIADAGTFSVSAPWDVDGGVDGNGLPFSFPDPATLPPATPSSQALALAGDARTIEVPGTACGEPPTCYLRTIIATARGHVYGASDSAAYPHDTCVTKTVDCDQSVLVGDPIARFADNACRAASPQISLGFLLPQSLLFGWYAGQLWQSTSGFRSEWTIVNGGVDSGAYEPMPGYTSKLWPAWSRYYAGGEFYGELLVPLRHSVTHTPAIGFALFDIRVRQ
jgi:hypothetical protein